jgi:hypothetical protein
VIGTGNMAASGIAVLAQSVETGHLACGDQNERTSLSARRACRLMGLSRTAFAYERRAGPSNPAPERRLVELAHERRRFGYRRWHALMPHEGLPVDRRRVWRLYQRRAWRRGGSAARPRPSVPTKAQSSPAALDEWAYGHSVQSRLIGATVEPMPRFESRSGALL